RPPRLPPLSAQQPRPARASAPNTGQGPPHACPASFWPDSRRAQGVVPKGVSGPCGTFRSAPLTPAGGLTAVPPSSGLPPAYNGGMEAPVCTGCRARDRLVADLRYRVSQLEAQVERLNGQLQQAQRAGKRQAAPFAKGLPQPEPKRPGRKPGPDYGLK